MCTGERNRLLMIFKSARAKTTPGRYKSKVGNIYTNTLVWVLSLALVGTPIVIDFHGNGK